MTVKSSDFLTGSDLMQYERELWALVPRDGAPAVASAAALTFNADASDVREALIEPARALLERGAASRELAACLQRTVADLVFWRTVLVKTYSGAFQAEGSSPAKFLVDYLLSDEVAGRRGHPPGGLSTP